MTDDNENKSMTPSQLLKAYNRNIEQAGETAWLTWIEIGKEVRIRRARASALAGGATRGPIYADRLQKLLGVFYPTYKKLSESGTLSHLDHCLDNLSGIESFRSQFQGDDKPNHPRRVWEAYQSSLTATDVDLGELGMNSVDEEADADAREEEGKRREPKSKLNSDRRKLLAEIDVLNEKLEEVGMTADAAMNAQRIWRGLVHVMGDRHAPEAAILTADELRKIGERLASREWEEAEPA